MILENTYYSKEENLNLLTEDTVKLLTNFTSRLEGKSFAQEYYLYIDNVISYFKQKQITLMHLGKKQIDKIYDNRKNAIKAINKLDDNSFVKFNVRKPNYKYFKIPMVDTVMSDTFLSNWTVDNNSKIMGYANCYSKGYNKKVKQLTNGEISEVSNMSGLIDVITDQYTINSKKSFMDYINSMIIPRDDLEYISKYIEIYISALEELKNKSVNDLFDQNEDTKFENKILYAIKMIDVKNLYVKNIINILLNIYMIKMSVFNFNGESEILESVNIQDMLYDRRYFTEAYSYITEGYNDDLKATVYSLNKDAINTVKSYLDTMYNNTINYIDSWFDINNEKLSQYIGLYYFNNIKELTKTVDCILNINCDNIDRFVETNSGFNFANSSNCGIFLNRSDPYDRKKLIEYFSHKDEIKESLIYDYNKITDHINDLLSTDDHDCIRTRLFDRYYTELPIYAKTEMENIKSYLLNNYDIKTEEYFNYFNLSKESNSFVKNIEDKYGHNVDIIDNIQRYHTIQKQYMNMMFIIANYEDSDSGFIKKNQYIDDLLLAYIIHFQNKVYKIQIM